jgi:hypothetical protein
MVEIFAIITESLFSYNASFWAMGFCYRENKIFIHAYVSPHLFYLFSMLQLLYIPFITLTVVMQVR